DVVVPGSVYYDGYEYTVTTIGEGAFKFASINSLVVGEGCTTIAGSSFNSANIAVSMTLPSTVTTISGAGDNGAGSTCPTIIIGSLEKGSQLTAINGSFMYNANVNDVYMYGTNPATTVGAYAFSKAPKIHVPDISLALYQACGWAKDGWSRTRNFVGDINVPMSWEDFQANVATYVAKGVKKGDSPNTFAEGEEVNAYLAALDAAKAMTEGTSSDDMKAAVKTLENTYAALPAALPLTEGYYYMVNNYEAYNEKYGVYPAIFTAPEFVRSSGASACLFDKFDANNANYIYKLTAKEGLEGGFYAQNAATGWYLNTGDGDTWYGEVTTCSETAVNAQIFKAYGVGNGAFWVADETDTNVSRAISGAASVPSRNYVFGWTTFADVVADNLKGYNTWTLIPVAEETVTTLVAKAEEEKAAKAAILAELEPLYASLADLATAVNNGEAPYDTMNEEVVTNFKNAYATAKTLVAIKKYNQGVSSETYTNGLANLKATRQALVEATPVNLEDGYYYIVNAASDFKNNHDGQNAAMCIDVAGEPIKWALFDNSQEKFVMEIKKQDSGNYLIKGYSTGAYFASTEQPDTYSNPVFTSLDAPVEQIIKHYEKYSEGAYVIHNVVNGWDWHPLGNNAGKGVSGSIVGWPAYMSEVSTWYFVKVTDEDWAAIAQGKRTEEAKALLNEANLALLDNVSEWTTNATLIKSDASNLSTNATSLDLGKLVNGNLSETTETWSQYPSSDAYLQVEIDDADLCSDLRLSIAPRTGQYYKADTPKSWIVTKSDDGENWSYVGEYSTDPDAIAEGQLFTYPVISLGSTAKYVRFTSPVAIENRTGKTTHFALGEFKLESVSAAATIDDANVSAAYTALVNAIDELRQAVDANTVTAEQKTAFETAYDTYAAAITEYNIPGGVWEIASEATAPAAGKTYAIKNVTNANYLTMKGVEGNVNVLNNTGVWTLEATGEQEDGLDTYYFKSVD
ncbi:MAG: leucine-rich repeat protein, partial [Bacteroidaceae bacterium]|nr:leucine-rich repeat protein [Bacteroidaceae bacterium]